MNERMKQTRAWGARPLFPNHFHAEVAERQHNWLPCCRGRSRGPGLCCWQNCRAESRGRGRPGGAGPGACAIKTAAQRLGLDARRPPSFLLGSRPILCTLLLSPWPRSLRIHNSRSCRNGTASMALTSTCAAFSKRTRNVSIASGARGARGGRYVRDAIGVSEPAARPLRVCRTRARAQVNSPRDTPATDRGPGRTLSLTSP